LGLQGPLDGGRGRGQQARARRSELDYRRTPIVWIRSSATKSGILDAIDELARAPGGQEQRRDDVTDLAPVLAGDDPQDLKPIDWQPKLLAQTSVDGGAEPSLNENELVEQLSEAAGPQLDPRKPNQLSRCGRSNLPFPLSGTPERGGTRRPAAHPLASAATVIAIRFTSPASAP
jgi:hypothetical protein